MRKILFFILLLAIFIVPSCDSERIIVYQTETQTQTQTVTNVRTITIQPTAIPTVTITVTGSPQSITETPFSPITITGSSSQKTAPFMVTTSEWIIDWSYIADPAYSEFAVFNIFIYPRGETVFYVESVLFPSSTSGTTYSYAGVGEYYIDVSSANVNSWSITIRPA